MNLIEFRDIDWLLFFSSDIAKHEGKLAKEMFGPEYEIISRIMKALVNKKITVPGSFLGLVFVVFFLL